MSSTQKEVSIQSFLTRGAHNETAKEEKTKGEAPADAVTILQTKLEGLEVETEEDIAEPKQKAGFFLEKKEKKTSNPKLQEQLIRWKDMLNDAFKLPFGSEQRLEAIKVFAATFVPTDVSHDDMEYYAGTLATDEEHFSSLVREITQCADGNMVESIGGGQKKIAIFTLLPLEQFAVDVVREISFISTDNGAMWTAEA